VVEAEDGIRDWSVTGVQTCALPIFNGERVVERTLAHADQLRFGQGGDTEVVFFIGEEAPSVERSAVLAATELRQMAALLEGLREIGRASCRERRWGAGGERRLARRW